MCILYQGQTYVKDTWPCLRRKNDGVVWFTTGNARTMPQIKIDDKLIGGYNQLVEHFADLGKVNFKGEII